MSEGITPVNWGRQADRIVTAGIILGAATLGHYWGSATKTAPIINVQSPVVNNHIPAPQVNAEIKVPKDSIVIKSEVENKIEFDLPLKVEIVDLSEIKAILQNPRVKEKRIEKAAIIVPSAKLKKDKVSVQKAVPEEGDTFPVAK